MTPPREVDAGYALAALEALSEGVVMQLGGGEIVACNAAAERILGLTRDQMTGRTSLDPRWRAIHEDGTPFPGETHPAMQTLRTGEPVRDVVMGVHRPDGSLRWISINSEPVRVGDEPAVVTTFVDVTGPRAIAEALKESEARYRQIFESSGEAILLTAPDGAIAAANPAAQRMLGRSEEEIRRAGRSGILDTTDPRLPSALAERERTGRFEGELNARRADGTTFPADVSSNVFRDASGRALTTTLMRDVSQRKRAEEERASLQAQLAQAQKMESIGRLAGGVAHDFNNMLGVILGFAELASAGAARGEPPDEALLQIRRAAERSASLTRQLLAFARRQPIAPTRLDLNASVERSLELLRPLLREDVTVAMRLAPDLWPVRLDSSQLEQVIANLCLNARDAITGPGTITIETGNAVLDAPPPDAQGVGTPGDYVLLSVADDGCGMPPEVLARVFEPFFTTKSVAGAERGTGLGLATVYGIVTQNGGFVRAESLPGRGSAFHVHFPRCREEDGERPRAAESPARSAPRGHETVLVVEDEPAVLQVTRRMLESLGYRVLPAGSASEALRVAAEHPGDVDLLLTDVVLPEMNGCELARRLLEGRPGLACVLTSGYPFDAIGGGGEPSAATAFLQKPFTRDELEVRVREALDERPPRGDEVAGAAPPT